MSKIEDMINSFLQKILASEKENKQIYKKYLPTQQYLIKINSNDYINSAEFSRILCSALDEELLAQTSTYTDCNNIDVECNIQGNKEDCYNTISQLTDSLADVFKTATKKIGSVSISTNIYCNKKSSYKLISGKLAELNYNKFMIKFA